jgi:Flp pilus assembly pilin Flp
MLKKLWLDEGGAILSFELMLIMVLLVIGISIGMVVLRDAVVSEFQCIAAAVNTLSPCYGWADLTYAGTASAAWVGATDASNAVLLIAGGTGQILDVVASDGITNPADLVAPPAITSP